MVLNVRVDSCLRDGDQTRTGSVRRQTYSQGLRPRGGDFSCIRGVRVGNTRGVRVGNTRSVGVGNTRSVGVGNTRSVGVGNVECIVRVMTSDQQAPIFILVALGGSDGCRENILRR